MSNIYVPANGVENAGKPRSIGVPPPHAGQYGDVWVSLSIDSTKVFPKNQIVRFYVNMGHAGAPNWQPIYAVCPAKPDGSGFDDSSAMFGAGATNITSGGRRFGNLPKGVNQISVLPIPLVGIAAFNNNQPMPTNDEDVGVDVMLELYPH